MKITTYHQRPDFSDSVITENLAKRIIHAVVVFLALAALAVVATIAVYWSFNNGTFTRFTI